MSRTRKYLTLTLLISGLFLPQVSRADNRGSQFSLSLDALGQGVFLPNNSSVSIGGGGQAFLDWRPIHFISFGVGAQYAYYPGTNPFKLTSFDLGGRLFPGETTHLGEFYLQGGLGLNLLAKPGHYHGYAGLGWRQFVGGDVALDLGAQYDFFSPIGEPLHAVSAKLGVAFLFGRDDWSAPAAPFKPLPKTFVLGAAWKGPDFYEWKPGDNFRTVAARLYGDEDFYPLLVDANKPVLSRMGFRPGLKLKVPPPPESRHGVDLVEHLALQDPDYVKWRKESEKPVVPVHDPPERYYRWRYGDDLASVARKLYGDDELYPLLVDANEERLILPANLVPGKVLKVPALPSENEMEEVRDEGYNDSHYLHWLNVSLEHLRNLKGI